MAILGWKMKRLSWFYLLRPFGASVKAEKGEEEGQEEKKELEETVVEWISKSELFLKMIGIIRSFIS